MVEPNSISLCDGKYFFFLDAKGTLICDRNQESWREFVGDKAVYALFQEALLAQKLRQVIEQHDR